MLLKTLFIEGFASFLVVLQRTIQLIFYPYKTMRKISQEQDYGQIGVFCVFVYVYFFIASHIRDFPYSSFILLFVFLFQFGLTILYFYKASRIFHKDIQLKSFLFTFTYSLIPTLLWFMANSALYVLIPPPRTLSMMGKAFSIFFISFSVSMLIWKIILVFLAVRFSGKLQFFKIIYLLLIYIALFLPYMVLVYYLKIFRVPFI
jgi:hypothetical protein